MARSLLCGSAVLWTTVLLLSPSPARAETAAAQLAVVGGTGILGGTVGVVIQLSNDVANAAISADLDIDFPTDVVEFTPPVLEHCRIATRLVATHQVVGRVPQPGLLRVAIVDATALDPLGDGELATCDFHILPDAMFPTADLTLEFVDLAGVDGSIPTIGVGGAILIADVTPGPTRTAGPTSTALPRPCVGDCNGDQTVAIDELVRGVRIALGDLSLGACSGFDFNGDGEVSISELISAVKSTLDGC